MSELKAGMTFKVIFTCERGIFQTIHSRIIHDGRQGGPAPGADGVSGTAPCKFLHHVCQYWQTCSHALMACSHLRIS